MQEHRRRLIVAIEGTVEPLNVAEECLSRREHRQGVDLVHDDLERCLTKVTSTYILLAVLKGLRSNKNTTV